jgi:hypothetical protein
MKEKGKESEGVRVMVNEGERGEYEAENGKGT